jgi:site-specific recombinase XerD
MGLRSLALEWARGFDEVWDWLCSVPNESLRLRKAEYFYLFYLYLQGVGEFRGLSPRKILEYQVYAPVLDRNRIANLLGSFLSSKSVEWRPNTLSAVLSDVRDFFSFYGVTLPRVKVELLQAYKEPSGQMLDRESLLKIFESAKLRDRAVIQICYGGGMGFKEFSFFNNSWDSVKEQMETGCRLLRIEEKPRKRNRLGSESFFTIVGRDGIRLLKDYLDERGEPRRGEPIFLEMSKKNFSGSFLRIAFRVGLIKERMRGLGVRYGYGVHQLRDVFRTEWQRSGADPMVAEFMMGHVKTVDPNKYLQFLKAPEYVYEEYRKAEPRLSLLSNPHPDMVRKDEVEELREQVERLQVQAERARKLEILLEDPDVYEAFTGILKRLKARKA